MKGYETQTTFNFAVSYVTHCQHVRQACLYRKKYCLHASKVGDELILSTATLKGQQTHSTQTHRVKLVHKLHSNSVYFSGLFPQYVILMSITWKINVLDCRPSFILNLLILQTSTKTVGSCSSFD